MRFRAGVRGRCDVSCESFDGSRVIGWPEWIGLRGLGIDSVGGLDQCPGRSVVNQAEVDQPA